MVTALSLTLDNLPVFGTHSELWAVCSWNYQGSPLAVNWDLTLESPQVCEINLWQKAFVYRTEPQTDLCLSHDLAKYLRQQALTSQIYGRHGGAMCKWFHCPAPSHSHAWGESWYFDKGHLINFPLLWIKCTTAMGNHGKYSNNTAQSKLDACKRT